MAIEVVCLMASIIDGCLRMGLILNDELTDTPQLDVPRLLLERDDEEGMAERKVYKLARHARIIDEDLFNELESLYKRRNRVIHRYLVSGIKYDDVLDLGAAYENIQPRVLAEIAHFERQHIERGTGIVVDSSEIRDAPDIDWSAADLAVRQMAQLKHGRTVRVASLPPSSPAHTGATRAERGRKHKK